MYVHVCILNDNYKNIEDTVNKSDTQDDLGGLEYPDVATNKVTELESWWAWDSLLTFHLV